MFNKKEIAVINCRLLLLLFLLFPSVLMAGEAYLTMGQIKGVWYYKGYPWKEGYEFKQDGSVDYLVRGNARQYQYKLVKNEIIIQREMGQTLNKKIISFDGKTMKVKDTFLDSVSTLEKEG